MQRTVAEVQQILDEAVRDGSESAVQVAVYLQGELIVDTWAAPEGWPVDGRRRWAQQRQPSSGIEDRRALQRWTHTPARQGLE